MDKKNFCTKNLCVKVLKLLFGKVAMAVFLIVFIIVGSGIFVSLECGAEELRRNVTRVANVHIQEARDYIVQILYVNASDGTFNKDQDAEYKLKTRLMLELYKDFIVNKVIHDGHHHLDEPSYDWTFPNALLFTITTIAAIGYGNISPVTFKGQMFCIGYGAIGVPFLLFVLALICDTLANMVKFAYSRLCCRWCRMKRFITDLGEKKILKMDKKEIWYELVGVEEYMPTDEIEVPMTLVMCIIVGYIILGGVIYTLMEGWPFVTSTYFSFITLTTIGFGDFVPSNDPLNLIITCTYCLLGMATITMCISLIQSQFVHKMDNLLIYLGCRDSPYDDSEPIPKRTNMAIVIQTPADKDGNNLIRRMRRMRNRLNGSAYKKSEPLLVPDEQYGNLKGILVEDLE